MSVQGLYYFIACYTIHPRKPGLLHRAIENVLFSTKPCKESNWCFQIYVAKQKIPSTFAYRFWYLENKFQPLLRFI